MNDPKILAPSPDKPEHILEVLKDPVILAFILEVESTEPVVLNTPVVITGPIVLVATIGFKEADISNNAELTRLEYEELSPSREKDPVIDADAEDIEVKVVQAYIPRNNITGPDELLHVISPDTSNPPLIVALACERVVKLPVALN
ncbi:MAG: hypothetical protein Q8910_00925 [Bacteroidota bacterium]|nr:hypothetical protein [Bacteroidota bacterium]